MSARNKLSTAAVVLLSIACAACWFGVFWPHLRHGRWYREIECLIVELAPRRPRDVTPRQWAYCLHHTWNLHTNYGNAVYWDACRAQEFKAEFRDRLRGEVRLDTIDWFWDAYVSAAPRAGNYLRYRPTHPEHLKEADSQGEYDLAHWLAKRGRGDCERLLEER
jgi:hypothetical protein